MTDGLGGTDGVYEGFYLARIFDCPPFRMFTAGDCHRANDILGAGKFEPASMRLWCKLVQNASAIYDIGAQVGVYSLAAAALRSDIPIHAFEPNPYAYARLRVHKRINGFANIVEHRCALADRHATTRLSWRVDGAKAGMISSGAALLEPERGCESVLVETQRLDSFAADMGRGAVWKIDVEGAEPLVLRGASDALRMRPDMILETFSAENCAQIAPILARLGYRCWRIHEDTGVLAPMAALVPADITGRDYNCFLSCGDGYDRV